MSDSRGAPTAPEPQARLPVTLWVRGSQVATHQAAWSGQERDLEADGWRKVEYVPSPSEGSGLPGERKEEFSGSTLPTPGTMFDDCSTCRGCGRPVGVVWSTTAAFWNEVAGDKLGYSAAEIAAVPNEGVGGVLCVRCFDIHARELGHQPHWSPTPSPPEWIHFGLGPVRDWYLNALRGARP